MPNVWKKVAVDIESALGTAKTITAVSKASEAVITATHDYSIGDYVRFIGITGMKQLDEVVARVKSVSTTVSFVAEGIDSTLWDTFVSGTVKKITFGTSMATVQEISPSGGEPEYTDTSTVHNEMDTEMPTGGFTGVTFGMTNYFEPADTALLALRAAMRSSTSLCMMMRFASGARIVGSYYPAAPFTPAGQSGAAVMTPVTFKARSIPTPYAS